MGVLSDLQPNRVFYFFEKISEIPRGSGNEKAVSDYIVSYANNRGLEAIQDKANNILIRKAGTKGYENSPTVILQGHIDMVCEKNNDTKHDFLTDPLKLRIDGDFIYAEGTTLGADNGIAVAYALALLDSDDIPHPPLEVVMTTDEEVGMGGADFFNASQLKGKIFFNMDTEEEGYLVVSCCGGVKATLHLPIEREDVEVGMIPIGVSIKGLKGGHSGMDINLQRANANKLMGRVLSVIKNSFECRIASINGGLMDNAISRENETVLLVKPNDIEGIKNLTADLQATFLKEYRGSDIGIEISVQKLNETVIKVFTKQTSDRAIAVLTLIPYGVRTVSLEMEGLVESSSNIGIVKTLENEIQFSSAVRSSVGSRKSMILEEIDTIAQLVGGMVDYKGSYPAWEFNPDSKLLDIFKETYRDMYNKEAIIQSIHAGLECGLFSDKVKGLDMISFGPDMFDVHTPDEKLSISSTTRVWEYLNTILKKLR